MFRTKDLVDGCAGAGERRRVIPDSHYRGWWGTHKDKEACAQQQQQESTLPAGTQAAVVAGQVLKLLTVYGLLVCVRRLERALK